MWPSLVVGNPNNTVDMGHEVLSTIASNLLTHPNVNETIAKSIASQTIIVSEEELPQPQYAPFSPTGEGWFEDKLGKSANQIIKDLRKARRVFKEDKTEIDSIIASVRALKSAEVDATLSNLPWSAPHQDTMRKMGLSNKDLRDYLVIVGNLVYLGLVMYGKVQKTHLLNLMSMKMYGAKKRKTLGLTLWR